MHMAVGYVCACAASSGRTTRGSHKDVTSRDYSRVPRVASCCLLPVPVRGHHLLGSVLRLAVSQHEPATFFAVCASFGPCPSRWCVSGYVRDHDRGLNGW